MIGYPRELDVIEIIRSDWQQVIDDLVDVGADSIMEQIADEIAHYGPGDAKAVHLTRRDWWEMIGALAVRYNVYIG